MKNSKCFGADIECKSLNTYHSDTSFKKEFWRDFEHIIYAEWTLGNT
jgi:hypothetical protein